MEKGTEDANSKIIRIAVTGPECTGKTTLTQQLAAHFGTIYVPEYARDYIADLCRPYTYDDVLHIAEVQRRQAHEFVRQASRVLFFDTYLIITKVWFDVVFGRHPEWIEEELSRKTIDFFLLCDTSIPWKADPVRENGGEMREKLFRMYKLELEKRNCPYTIITGTGQPRLNSAIQAVDQFMLHHSRL